MAKHHPHRESDQKNGIRDSHLQAFTSSCVMLEMYAIIVPLGTIFVSVNGLSPSWLSRWTDTHGRKTNTT